MRFRPLLLAAVLLVGGVAPSAAGAWELGGFASLGGGQATWPADNFLYLARDEQPWSANFRLLAEAGGGLWHLSANLLEAMGNKPPLAPAAGEQSPREVERSSGLTWEQHDSAASRAALTADVLALQHRSGPVDVTAGRQPISLATTFCFSPNDFFAPFAAQNFFRTYRPGVDGLRIDWRLAPLSQAALLGVLAYEVDGESANGWKRAPQWSRSAVLAMFNHEWRGCGWNLLGGTVADRTLAGGGLQGELFDWLGVRAEGHYALAERRGAGEGGRFTVGVEHRQGDDFDWRLEYHYNGYLGRDIIRGDRHYTALGMGYQFTPLLSGNLLALADLHDGSRLYSVNLLYSLSDESELTLTSTLPQGLRPAGSDPGSEFGRQPRQLLLEYRITF